MKHYCLQCGEEIIDQSVVLQKISTGLFNTFCCDDCFDEFTLSNKCYGYIDEKGVLHQY